MAAGGPPPTLNIIATDLLHAGARSGKEPRYLEADWLAQLYAVNAIDPALVGADLLLLTSRTVSKVVASSHDLDENCVAL